MNALQYQYLWINKYLMCIIGQWPYQTALERLLVSIVFVPTVTAQAILQGGGMITALQNNDIDASMEDFAPFIISCMCLIKLANYTYNHEQMKNLMNVMEEDWAMYSKSEYELAILCQTYAVGKKVTVNYATSLYGSMTPFMVVPVLLEAADSFGFYNNSGGRRLMFRLEHFVNVEKYHYPLLLHSYVGTLGFITIVVGIDSMMVQFVQHECGVCQILGRRLESIVEDSSADLVFRNGNKREDKAYQNAKNCVIMHNRIIKFARHLEEANSMSYFLQLGFNMAGITFTGFQAVMRMDNPNESFRHASFAVCLLSVLLLESWPGQQLSDYTDRIFEYTTSGKWYYTSSNVRRLLNIMLLRSIIPIKLTAGKIYTLNLQNFSAVVRTSFSYFTVLCSLQ